MLNQNQHTVEWDPDMLLPASEAWGGGVQVHGHKGLETANACCPGKFSFGKWLSTRCPLVWAPWSAQALASSWVLLWFVHIILLKTAVKWWGSCIPNYFLSNPQVIWMEKKSNLHHHHPIQNAQSVHGWRDESKMLLGSKPMQMHVTSCCGTSAANLKTGLAIINVDPGQEHPQTFFASLLIQWIVQSIPFHVSIVVEYRKI